MHIHDRQFPVRVGQKISAGRAAPAEFSHCTVTSALYGVHMGPHAQSPAVSCVPWPGIPGDGGEVPQRTALQVVGPDEIDGAFGEDAPAIEGAAHGPHRGKARHVLQGGDKTAAAALAAVSVVLQLYVPFLFGDAIDEIVAQGQVNFSRMWDYLSRILIMVLLSGAATWIMNMINNRMTYRTVQDIRSKAIRHIQVLPLSYLDRHSTGDIISRVIADTDILSDGLLLGFT